MPSVATAVNPALEIALPGTDEGGSEAVKQAALTAEHVQRLAAAASAHHPSYGLLVDLLAVPGLRMSSARPPVQANGP